MAATEALSATDAVAAAAREAGAAAPAMAAASDETVERALRAMADRLVGAMEPILAANAEDQAAAEANGMSGGLLDRLRLDKARVEAMAAQLNLLAGIPAAQRRRHIRDLDGGLVL